MRGRLAVARHGRDATQLIELVVAAVRDCPDGLARKYIGRDIPVWINDAVSAAVSAILTLGDDLPTLESTGSDRGI